jgi:hypothetical protein
MRAEHSERVLRLNTCTPSLATPRIKEWRRATTLALAYGSLAPARERERIGTGRLPHSNVFTS